MSSRSRFEAPKPRAGCPGEGRELGLSRRIGRRDFLNGVAVGTTATLLALRRSALWADAVAESHPPALTGLRGQHPGSFEAAHRVRDGDFEVYPSIDVDTREAYDLVVVGGGISGLSAAYFYRKALGDDARVLILDNHDDFGGHAKRNEFRHRGRLFIGYGGTQSISTPFPYSFVAKALLEELGIAVGRYEEFRDRTLYERHGLCEGVFFDRESFGEDRLVVGHERLPWEAFFERAPLSEEVRRELVRIHTSREDYWPELTPEQKAARLAKISYRDYLVDVARLPRQALPFFAGMGFRNNMRMDTAPAWKAARSGAPGFLGLALPPEIPWGGEESFTFHFPDGGATIARLLVQRLVPRFVEGSPQTMQTILEAPVRYARLDEAGAPVRVRLQSTVVRVLHEGEPERASIVRIAYARGGKLHEVRARGCVLACFNSIVRFLMPELPVAQKQALAYPVKVPMLYTNVFVRNWKAFAKLGVSSVLAPNLYYTSARLDYPVSIGGYRCSRTPDEPIVIHMVRNPNAPGLPRKEQQRAGMRELLTTSFETLELETRRQLARMLGPGGFEPDTDILAITANRWPHGYAYTYDSLGDPELPEAERPHVLGRRPFGLVTIANSDSGAAAFINVAIDEAQRAVQELIRRRGLS